ADPTQARVQLTATVRYGFQVAAGVPGEPPLVMLSPVVFRPIFTYDATVPAAVVAAVQDWLTSHAPTTGRAAEIDLAPAAVPAILPDQQHPLIDLTRLVSVLASG